MSFFGKFKPGSTPQNAASAQPKKDPNAAQPTALEKHLGDVSGPSRPDGSDKFFGFENYGSTCYCNSIIQCLYYSTPFRDNVLSFPPKPLLEALAGSETDQDALNKPRSKSTTPYPNPTSPARKEAPAPGSPSPGPTPSKPEETKDSPEYKKKQAIKAGPVLAMTDDHSNKYFMDESLFTSMKQMFEAIIENDSRLGVVSPHRFLEILRREKEEFRSPMHQDAHEFFNILLNEVVENVDMFSKQHPKPLPHANGGPPEGETALTKPVKNGTSHELDTHWVHDLFEGLLTSETKCLTCETTSRRDEEFLDLSVDLEPHTSVTACLQKFSEEEMLCERNKFHCDNCGGLQEAEKRMKIKRLPKILALHLKRFKYTEDLQRLQKVFHKVVYPFHLRLFNTTDDAEDPDRLYELYAVVVHIGGGPYHGHYVSIIKTQDRGWLLFDDELVEPVDKSYVLNFFGGEPVPSAQDARQLACAYVLFYQETTLEAVLKEQEMEGQQPAAASAPARPSDVDAAKDVTSPKDAYHHFTAVTTPLPEDVEGMEPLAHARTEPALGAHLNHLTHTSTMSPIMPTKSRKERKAEEKERKAKEKAEQKAEEQKRREQSERRMHAWKQQQDELKRVMEESKVTAAEESKTRGDAAPTESEKTSGLARFRTGSMSLRSKPRLFGKDKTNNNEQPANPNGLASVPQGHELENDAAALSRTISNNPGVAGEEKKFRHRFSLSRKKSQGLTQN